LFHYPLFGNVISYGCANYYETMWYATEKI